MKTTSKILIYGFVLFGFAPKLSIGQSSCVTCSAHTSSTATGTTATAFGEYNTASGDYSTAFGHNNIASGLRSLAFGYNNEAAGSFSLVGGSSSLTSSAAHYSLAYGLEARANGWGAFAMGHNVEANDNSSFVFGTGTIVDEIVQDPLVNDIPSSFLVGFNSNPSLFVKENMVGIAMTNPQQALDVNGAIRLGTTSTSTQGSIRWSGADFEGYTAMGWKSLTSTAGWMINGNNGYYDAGSVGIGTNSPTTKLDVNQTGGASGSAAALRLRAGNNAAYYGNNQILFSHNGSALYSHAIKTRHGAGGSAGNAIDFYLWKYGVDGTSTVGTQHVMTLEGTGHVGIGTTTPDAGSTLDVRGYGRFGDADKYIRMGYDGGMNHIDSHGDDLVINYYTPNSRLDIHSKTVFSTTAPIVSWSKLSIGIDDDVKTAGYSLAVAGKIVAEEVDVKLQSNWPDYVFENKYHLMSIEDLDAYIQANKHLPGIKSAEEMDQNGSVPLGEMTGQLLQKIEELTLYIIEQNKRIENLEKSKN